MKTSVQLKALVRNLSAAKNVKAEIILRNYMLERLLERIASSRYKNSFILKGGLLITAMVGIDTRATMDLDATIKGLPLTRIDIIAMFSDILHIVIDDNVAFSLLGIEEIREGADYPGFRASIEAILDKTRQILKVDITTGDFITPGAIEFNFRLMFEGRSISIMAYNPESVLAEKFETVITRGVANTRMRDFYDVYILTALQSFDAEVFRLALQKTVENRNTILQTSNPEDVIRQISTNTIMIGFWRQYQKTYGYAADVTWEMAIDALRSLADLVGK